MHTSYYIICFVMLFKYQQYHILSEISFCYWIIYIDLEIWLQADMIEIQEAIDQEMTVTIIVSQVLILQFGVLQAELIDLLAK